MSDDDSNQQDSFYAGPKPDQDRQQEKVVTKGSLHKSKKKQIQKRKQKGNKGRHGFSKSQSEKKMKIMQIADQKANEIVREMEKRYSKDQELYSRKQLACKKLSYLDVLSSELKNVYIGEKFLEAGGLGNLEKWLTKVSVGDHGEFIEPSIALRKGVFEILLSLNVKGQHLVRAQQLQRIIERNKRSQAKQLRDLSEQIISKWSQMSYQEVDE